LFLDMKTDVTPAIIMRVRKMGESDLLVTFFTPHKGQLKGVAKGAMKSCKRFVNALDLFSLVHLEYAPRRQGNLCLLHSGKLQNAYPEVRRNFSSLSHASFMIELVEILFPPGVTEPHVFELLSQAFGALSRSKRGDLVPLVFELKAMALGGYRIDTTKCSKCGRRYQGEGMAVFTRERGGIACLKCRQPTSVSPPLNPATVKAVETLLNEAFEEVIESNLAENTIQELRAILKLHREYQLEQRLRTSKYVDC
jgi:DNA repair protein RecO (recombination protein O)